MWKAGRKKKAGPFFSFFLIQGGLLYCKLLGRYFLRWIDYKLEEMKK